jgi:hypothetical protein
MILPPMILLFRRPKLTVGRGGWQNHVGKIMGRDFWQAGKLFFAGQLGVELPLP